MEFFSYLGEHPELVASVVLFVISLLTIILKKKPTTVDDFLVCVSETVNLVPTLVKSVEIPGNGVKKKTEVMVKAQEIAKRFLKRDLSASEIDILNKRVSDAIERVLEAPQKKGV